MIRGALGISSSALGSFYTLIDVSAAGAVLVRTAGNLDDQVVGNLTIAEFANPKGLSSIGQNLLAPTSASGPALVGVAGLGELQQGALEGSNTDLVPGLIGLLIAKHGVSIRAQIVRNGSEMLNETVNLLA